MAEEMRKGKHGKKNDQKMKPYLVYEYLMRYSDANHVVSASELVGYLQECGISAERRSVYRDIDAINEVILLAHGEASTIAEAREFVAEGQRTIVYDASQKGYYYDHLFCDFEDIRLAVECIYAAKFVDKTTADRIIDEMICCEVSEYQVEEFKNDIFVSDRARTTNKQLWRNIEIIREAMRHRTEDDPDDKKKYKHRPEQISFHYLTHTIGNVENQIERGRGAEYVVSPHKLMFCDGYYYLLAYNAKMKSQKVRTYRIDRMRNVKRIKDSESEGMEEVKQIDLQTYTQTHFNMFEGESELVTIRFTRDLLDAIIERFGTKNARYIACDTKHFTVTTRIHLSNPFYGWVFGFGKKAKIISPQSAVDGMTKMIESLSCMYHQRESK